MLRAWDFKLNSKRNKHQLSKVRNNVINNRNEIKLLRRKILTATHIFKRCMQVKKYGTVVTKQSVGVGVHTHIQNNAG